MKKSMEELREIREKTLEKIEMRTGTEGYRIVVGMATCGIASGARPVLTKIMEEIDKRNIINVTVRQTGCLGMCQLEPIVEVIDLDGNKTTYVNMTPEKTERMMEEHIVGGNVVREYTLTVIDHTIVNPKESKSE
jgi:NADP-reducing hydrogenase subunit HndB